MEWTLEHVVEANLVATEHASKTKISATFTLQGMVIYNSRRNLRSMQKVN